MKQYVDLVFKKEKKPIDINKVYTKVENLMKKNDEEFDGLSKEQKLEIDSILDKGVASYQYIKTPNDRYISINKTSFRKGRFHGNRNGAGFVTSTISYVDKEGNHIVKEQKISVLKENCAGAIDGDLVLVDVGRNGEKPKIQEIIDRNLENVMGEVVRIGPNYFVKPIDKKKQFLTIALEGEAIEGQRVAVNLKKQTSTDFYIGEITRVFNHKDDPDEDILWEAFKCGIDDQFSEKSLAQVKNIPQTVKDTDKIGREDLTDWEVFTIDGADTKDIDDALSCKKLDNGNYLVGVHIADVDNYVPESSPLDLDAFKKGTSNYLAGKVIPMLPHELSNGICSLNPHVERLTLSCIMELNPQGKIVRYKIVPSVIKSRLKMTYTKVNQILKGEGIDSEYVPYEDSLRTLNKLALILRKNRLKAGAVEFNRPELKLVLDENGQVSDFDIRHQDLGENLIEEFMLLANETVDKHLSDLGYPCLHRVHGKPNEERLDRFLQMLAAINYPYYAYSAEECVDIPKALQGLADHIKDTGRLSNMLSTNMVRCMSRARYSPINIGHSGLAKENYCHFTSPIRRYPDLTVHRILKTCYFNDSNKDTIRKWEAKLPEIGYQSSKMERIEDDAEQQTLAMKCSEYMAKHVGEEYEGTVIGLSDRGMQIQLDNMVEGMVRTRYMLGDYVYNPVTFTLLSLNGKDDYYIGDRLLVKVFKASKEDKTIDFSVCGKIDENKTINSKKHNMLVKKRAREERLVKR